MQKQIYNLFPRVLSHVNCLRFVNCLRYLSDKANENKKDMKTKLYTFGQRSFTFLAPRCLETCIGREWGGGGGRRGEEERAGMREGEREKGR